MKVTSWVFKPVCALNWREAEVKSEM